MYTFIKKLLHALGGALGSLILLMLDIFVPMFFKTVPPQLRGAVPIGEAIAHDYVVKNAIAHNRRIFRLIVFWLGVVVFGLIFWLVSLIWR